MRLTHAHNILRILSLLLDPFGLYLPCPEPAFFVSLLQMKLIRTKDERASFCVPLVFSCYFRFCEVLCPLAFVMSVNLFAILE